MNLEEFRKALSSDATEDNFLSKMDILRQSEVKRNDRQRKRDS